MGSNLGGRSQVGEQDVAFVSRYGGPTAARRSTIWRSTRWVTSSRAQSWTRISKSETA